MRLRISRNGAAWRTPEELTMRIRPARSRTNRRPLPSPAATMPTGWAKPPTTRWSERRRPVSEVVVGAGVGRGVGLRVDFGLIVGLGEADIVELGLGYPVSPEAVPEGA